MAYKCPTCGASAVSFSIGDTMQCLECTALFNSKGETVERGPDATTRAVNEARMAPRTTNLTGNLADLQRAGATKAVDPKEPDYQLPAGVDKDDVDKGEVVNRASEVVAEMSRTDIEPPDEPMDVAKAQAAKADHDLAAEVNAATKKAK